MEARRLQVLIDQCNGWQTHINDSLRDWMKHH